MEQRIIKFRCWWPGIRQMKYFVPGHFEDTPSGYAMTFVQPDGNGSIFLGKAEVMQYAGYQDFYEGDIVESANGKQWIIVWRDFGWWIDNKNIVERGRNKMAGNESYRLAYYISMCEQSGAKFVLKKVGNIYENPEFVLITQPA